MVVPFKLTRARDRQRGRLPSGDNVRDAVEYCGGPEALLSGARSVGMPRKGQEKPQLLPQARNLGGAIGTVGG